MQIGEKIKKNRDYLDRGERESLRINFDPFSQSELDGEIRNLHSEVFKSQKIIEQTEFDNAER